MEILTWFFFFTTSFCLQSSASSKAIKQPALGRPFKLGALYDLKSDALVVHGPSLWTDENLEKSEKTMKRKSKFEILTSDSNIQAQFGVSSETNLSILGGSIKVSGSAKYLDDDHRCVGDFFPGASQIKLNARA